MNDLLAAFIFFFAVIDPIGTIPVFIAVTNNFDSKTKRKIAIQATLISAIILLFFIVAGELILNSINVPLSAFQIAGGVVVFLFALTMIFGDSKPEEEIRMASKATEKAIFPLAVPSIASPGAMLSAVLLTENTYHTIWEQVQISLTMLAVIIIVLILMISSNIIHRVIGNSGAAIISKVMGLILASVAVAQVLAGIKEYFSIQFILCLKLNYINNTSTHYIIHKSIDINNGEREVEQITKADRNACHALCRMAKSAPRYGGLVPPLYFSWVRQQQYSILRDMGQSRNNLVNEIINATSLSVIKQLR
jgi:multiple antibiotic resistance protein